ncbi:MAG TPA: ABC-2 family transporter protein [Actinopolymorphaceae bacterium]|jgi:ABC-2 type transport system permease protein
MRVYAAIALRTFRRYTTYRAATAAGVFTNTIFGVILAYTYIALWEAKPGLGGYDVPQALTYVWLGQSLLAPMAFFGGGFEQEFGERIRKGDIAIDFYRPVDMQIWWLAVDAGRAAFQLLGRGIIPTLVGALIFPLALPRSPLTWLAFFTTVALGLVVSYAIRYIVALLGFWLLDLRGVQTAAGIIGSFMSGMLLPLTVFPGGMADFMQAMPWSCGLQIPADVLMGKHQGVELFQVFAFQAMWAVVLLLAGRALTAVATSKVVVQGG